MGLAKVSKVAVVVPHFELANCKPKAAAPPKHFTELVAMLVARMVYPFHTTSNMVLRMFRDANLDQVGTWLNASTPGDMQYLHKVKSGFHGCTRPSKVTVPSLSLTPLAWSTTRRRLAMGCMPVADALPPHWTRLFIPATHTRAQRIWTDGVRETRYNDWYRDSAAQQAGIFRLPIDGLAPFVRAIHRKTGGDGIGPKVRLRAQEELARIYKKLTALCCVLFGPSSASSFFLLAQKFCCCCWEPFLIVRRFERHTDLRFERHTDLPRFTEVFVGRYRNKVEFVSSLRAKKYAFFTILREFITHTTHPTALAKDPDMRTLQDVMARLYEAHL